MSDTQLTGGKAPRVQAARYNAFNAAKQDAFFAALAETCNVTLAAKRARVGKKCVYEHKARDAAFRARWAEVLSEAYRRLELMMLERAMNGTVTLPLAFGERAPPSPARGEGLIRARSGAGRISSTSGPRATASRSRASRFTSMRATTSRWRASG